MSQLADHLNDYLTLRRGLGFKLKAEGVVLPKFVAYLHTAGAGTVTTDLAIAWAKQPPDVHPVIWARRLGWVREFARYLKTIDPATEIPPHGVFPRPYQRPSPYLYSEDNIADLLSAARGLRPSLRAATMETLLGLLAVTGMRIGEALALQDDDVDLDTGVLTVTWPKTGRARLVPVHRTTTEALHRYARRRDRLNPRPGTSAFFVSRAGHPLTHSGVYWTFNQLTTTLGLRTETVKARVHDLRHSFAVRCLLDWYRDGVDVAARMATLSTYLGHTNPAFTYWYLSASPELMEQAALRLDKTGGDR